MEDVTYELWVDETLAQDEIRMRKICQCFQKNANNVFRLETCRIELVQFENG